MRAIALVSTAVVGIFISTSSSPQIGLSLEENYEYRYEPVSRTSYDKEDEELRKLRSSSRGFSGRSSFGRSYGGYSYRSYSYGYSYGGYGGYAYYSACTPVV